MEYKLNDIVEMKKCIPARNPDNGELSGWVLI